MKNVVILGAGWTGLPLAHKLLKYTIPRDPDNLKVILVSPNSHFFWNVAATRGIIPDEIPDEDLFLPIQPAFARYPSKNFEFVQGAAESIDPETNTVRIRLNTEYEHTISYNQLVIATGSRLAGNLPLKPLGGTHEATLSAWTRLQQSIASSHSIAISGGGPTSIEVAGELAARYGSSKQITLILSGDKPLGGGGGGDGGKRNHKPSSSSPGGGRILPSVRDVLDRDLQTLGVNIIRNTKVISSPPSASSSSPTPSSEEKEDTQQQKHLLTLSSSSSSSTSSSLLVDLHLPFHGIRPNTDFVPAQFLSSLGERKTKTKPDNNDIPLTPHLRLPGTSNIWALGDVAQIKGDPKQLTVTDAQIVYLSGILDRVILTEEEARGELKLDPYKPAGGGEKPMIFLSLGKGFATGQIGGWRLWGWLVRWVKGRRLFVDTARGYVEGKKLRHEGM